MSKILDKINYINGLILTIISSIFNKEYMLFLGYLILNITDYITGTIKAKIKGEENSSKGTIGVIKKISYWILIFISFLVTYLLTVIGEKINIKLNFIMIFGWFTLACLIINEARSIIENLIESGVKVPAFLKKGLEIYEKMIDEKINK